MLLSNEGSCNDLSFNRLNPPKRQLVMASSQHPEYLQKIDAFDPHSTQAFQRRMERAPEWFCSFLAGNSREKSRLRREIATMKGSVVWLVQQRRQGTWRRIGVLTA